ncbi:MAG: alpha/beta hydrolase family protein [Thermodesulfobacteriota bacterium]
MVEQQKRLLTYKTDDGFEVNSLLITPEFSSERDLYETPIVIIVHGVLGNFLAKGTPEILPPALRKNGISSLSVNTRMAFLGQIMGDGIFDETIQEIRESVEILKEEGFKNIFILGYSLGANVAVYFTTETKNPDIQGLILEGCSHSLPDSQKRRLERNKSIPSYDDIYQRAKEILGSDPYDKKNDQVFIIYRAWGKTFEPKDVDMFTYRTWWFMRSPEAENAKTCNLISKVRVPILFIQGDEDDVVDKWESKELKKILKQSGNDQVQLKYIPEAKHDCMENPSVTTEPIVNWLTQFKIMPLS